MTWALTTPQTANILIEGQNLLQLPRGTDPLDLCRKVPGWCDLLPFLVGRIAVFCFCCSFGHFKNARGCLLLFAVEIFDGEVLELFPEESTPGPEVLPKYALPLIAVPRR
jgi:hypothetical protein